MGHKKTETFVSVLVPRAGIEPARVSSLVFETNASTNSATWAGERKNRCLLLIYCLLTKK